LSDFGFTHDEKRTCRRILLDKQLADIVEIQIGRTLKSGKFTVNLGVYSPSFFVQVAAGTSPPELHAANSWDCLPGYCQRLGFTRTTTRTRLWGSILGAPDSWWKNILYGPRDLWWAYSDNHDRTLRRVQECADLLLGSGIAWFDRMHDIEAMRAAYQQTLERIARNMKKQMAEPTAPPNDDPATPLSNSEVTEEPPSVN
jgi:hypothetical protein